jgi:hypothetical protein
MAAGKSVEDILSGAKDTLSKADALSTSVKGEIPSPPAPVTKHEYSAAPYSLVNRAKKATGNEAGPGMSKELSAKKSMLDKAKKALE